MKSSSLLHGKRYGHNFLGLCCSSSQNLLFEATGPQLQLPVDEKCEIDNSGMYRKFPGNTLACKLGGPQALQRSLPYVTFTMTLLTSRSASPSICWRASQSYNWRRTAANYVISYATEILLSSCLARAQKALPRIQGEQEVHLLLPGPPRNREELEGGCLRSRSILGLWRTLRRGPSGGWAATADEMLASKSWLWHCSEKNSVWAQWCSCRPMCT